MFYEVSSLPRSTFTRSTLGLGVLDGGIDAISIPRPFLCSPEWPVLDVACSIEYLYKMSSPCLGLMPVFRPRPVQSLCEIV